MGGGGGRDILRFLNISWVYLAVSAVGRSSPKQSGSTIVSTIVESVVVGSSCPRSSIYTSDTCRGYATSTSVGFGDR